VLPPSSHPPMLAGKGERRMEGSRGGTYIGADTQLHHWYLRRHQRQRRLRYSTLVDILVLSGAIIGRHFFLAQMPPWQAGWCR
jgi:hypothetical protein